MLDRRRWLTTVGAITGAALVPGCGTGKSGAGAAGGGSGEKPDIIYAPIYYNQMAQIARQAKAAGIKGSMFVGGDGWDAEELLKDAGEELDGAYFTDHYAPDVPWPNAKSFLAKYKERFKRDPSSLAAMGYDAAKLLFDAMGRAKGDTPDDIRQAIADTKNFAGATGNISIDKDRNADKAIVIVQVKDKKFSYFATVNDKSAGAAGASGNGSAGPAPEPAPAGTAMNTGGVPDSGQEWKVGAYLSMSGEDTAFGTDTKEGIELAVDEANAAGGPKGRKIKMIYEDDKSQPNEATNKVLQLIDRDKVVAILGEVASSRSRAGGIVCNKKKIPMISPSSTNADVTKVGPYVFRVCFTDDVQGQMGAEFIVNKLGKKKVAILYASDDLYSSGLAKEFRDRLTKLGGTVVIEKSFLKKETNFTTYLNEIVGGK